MPTQKRIQTISFLVLLGAVLVIILLLLRPFVNLLALGLILTILLYPVYSWILRRVKYPSIASAITVALILIVLGGIIWFFGQTIYNAVDDLYKHYRDGGVVIDKDLIIARLPQELQNGAQNLSGDINLYVGRVSSEAFNSLSSVLSNVAGFFVALSLEMFIVYYLLKDGSKIKKILMDISPIATSQEDILFARVSAAVNGTVKGSLFVAVAQGIVATVGYFIFGLPSPLLWGAFTAFAALVPTVGTLLATVPAVLYLLVTGHIPQAIGMAIWAMFAVGLIDNFLSPKLVGRTVRLHPLLVLLAVIGGLRLFGVIGFLIGPIIMAVFVTLIEMYRTDFKHFTRS